MAENLESDAVATDMAIQYCAQFSALRTALVEFFEFMFEQDAKNYDVHRSIKNEALYEIWRMLENLPDHQGMWQQQMRPSIRAARIVSNVLNLTRQAVFSADLLPEEE